MSKMRRPITITKTKLFAMHEAAHAVVALTFGIDVKVRVIDDETDGSGGYTDIDGTMTVEQGVMIHLAGYVAEAQLNVPHSEIMVHAGRDLEEVHALLTMVNNTTKGRVSMRSKLIDRTAALLTQKRSMVEKIASQLMTGEEMSITVQQYNDMV